MEGREEVRKKGRGGGGETYGSHCFSFFGAVALRHRLLSS